MPYITEEQLAKYNEIERKRKEHYKRINERNKKYIDRISVALPKETNAKFCAVCEEAGVTKNGTIVSLIEDFIRDYRNE